MDPVVQKLRKLKENLKSDPNLKKREKIKDLEVKIAEKVR